MLLWEADIHEKNGNRQEAAKIRATEARKKEQHAGHVVVTNAE
jgi:hypothetical protein